MNRLRPMVALLAGLVLSAAAAGQAPATPPPEPSVAPSATAFRLIVDTPDTYTGLAPVALERLALSAPALYSAVIASDLAPRAGERPVGVVLDVERPPSDAMGYDGSAEPRPPFLYEHDNATLGSDLSERSRTATLATSAVNLRL